MVRKSCGKGESGVGELVLGVSAWELQCMAIAMCGNRNGPLALRKRL